MGTAPPTRGPARRDARLHAEGRNGERVLTDGDLEELSSVIRFELVTANRFRFFARGDLVPDLVRTGVAPHSCSHRAIVCVPLVELKSAGMIAQLETQD